MSASPLRSGAKSTKVALIAFAAVSLLSLPLRCWFVLKGEASAAIDGGFAGLAGLLEFVAIILFAGWLRTAYGTLPFFGFRTRYTPRMAVAVFLIPFSNYFHAGDVVDELIAGTDFTKVAPTARVQRVRISTLVRAWWYVFIAGATLSSIATAILLRPGSVRGTTQLIELIVIAQLLLVGAALLAMRFVDTIESRMQNCLARLRMTGQKDVEQVISVRPIRPSELPLNVLHASLLVFVLVRVFDIMLAVRLQTEENPSVSPTDRWLILCVLGIFVITALAFVWWVARLATNLHAMGLMTMSPGWAVGGLFIPIFNVVHAHSVMRAMWRGAQKQEESSAPAAITIWFIFWSATVLTASYMQAIQYVAEQHDTFIILNYVVSFLIIISALALYVASSEINEHAQFVESQFIINAQALKRAALGAVRRTERPLEQARPAAKQASWTEVLLPIATAVDQGLVSETPEQRQVRALVDKQAAAQRAVRRPRVPAEKVIGTGILTKVLRVVMLFTLLFAEIALFIFGGDSGAVRGTAVVRLTLFVFFFAFFGLPTWMLLAAWVFMTQRNLEAIDPWTIVTPSRSAMFRLRETSVLRSIIQTTFDGIDASHERRLRTWTWSLRVVQLAPVILFVVVGTVLAPIGALVLAVALIVWCIMTAAFVREIDDGVQMLPLLIQSRAPEAPGPDAPEDRPRESERGDADGGNDGPAVIGEYAGGE